MKALYFLPPKYGLLQLQKAHHDYRIAKRLHQVSASDDGEYEKGRDLARVIGTAPKGRVIVVPSIEWVSAKAIGALKERRGDSVSLRVLDPPQEYDPRNNLDLAVLDGIQVAVASIEKRLSDEIERKRIAAEENREFLPKTPDSVIAEIREMRRAGASLNVIAKKTGTSKATAWRYCSKIGTVEKLDPKPKEAQIPKTVVGIEGGSELDRLVSSFLLTKGPATRKIYNEHLTRFFTFAEAAAGRQLSSISDVDLKLAVAYRDDLVTKARNGLSTYHIGSIRLVKSLYSFAVLNGYAKQSPLLYMKVPELVSRDSVITDPLSVEEIQKILGYMCERNECATKETVRRKWFKMFVSSLILATSGLRVGSILKLRMRDITVKHDGNVSIMVAAKGCMLPVEIMLPKEASAQLIRFKEECCEGRNDDSYIFGAGSGKRPMGNDRYLTIFRSVLKRCAINVAARKLSSHSFRVSWATRAYETGMSLVAIQKRLGHKSQELTIKYIKVRDTHLDQDIWNIGGKLHEATQGDARH